MRRLRILHLGKYYPPVRGGIETVVETLCQGEATWARPSALVLNKMRATVAEEIDGVPVRRVGGLASLGAVTVTPSLPFWLRRAEADVLVLHEPNPMALVAYALARPDVPSVVWFHSEVIRSAWQYRLLYEPFLEFALRRAARIVVASPPMLEAAPLAAYRSKSVVVPYGLPPDRYAATSAIARRVEEMRRAASTPTVLFVGRLVAYKGVDVLLRALSGIDARTVVIGEGPLRSQLEALASDLGVGDRVSFLGGVEGDELVAWLHACDLFVLPSATRQETFGMVQLEAMLCGRPVVSTALGTGVSWVNQHERTGLVVRPGDPNDLRQALVRLLGDPGLRRRFGEAARQRVLDHFTAERMCSATRTLYQDVRRNGSPAPRSDRAAVA